MPGEFLFKEGNMMWTIEDITKAIIADPQNKAFTEQGINPLFAAPKNARINIVGQAPGLKTQQDFK